MPSLELLLYLPLAGALIGVVTKWIALTLVFHPDQFVGIGQFGWQGIVQRRSPKFAAGVAETVLTADFDLDSILESVDPTELVGLLAPTVAHEAPALAADLVEELAPGRWAALDESHRDAAVREVTTATLALLADALAVGAEGIARRLDVARLVEEQLSGANGGKLARLIRAVGARELRFAIYYGGIIGFLLGAVGVVGYAWVEQWWILPLVGAIDGSLNNWLAIQMIFRPIERRRLLGPISYQGLFAARRHQIAHDYGRFLADEVLTPRNLVANVSETGASGAVFHEVLDAVTPGVERFSGELASLVDVPFVPGSGAQVLSVMSTRALPIASASIDELDEYVAKRLEVAATIESRLNALPAEEFERVLRGIFEEDESTLVVIGAVVGAAIGTLQAVVLFAWS